ncbi:mercuric reductase [Galdieria sulphuraria]|uniref:Mercuric reductase n=1 Tax=Galdieria sulphuraria TaxID=130081 RepID=M2X923_GALSU|nr:mercuric reductase [Galdieria sulphuraria]EME26317.1 mercuric reductase [Galdieria sulphuraria]|eukprot:XP_005702837.1 mercuric reductase [Galdieria sulphuraria]
MLVAAALEAAESGLSILLVNHGTIGGTCVNVGCVPSKMQIHVASLLHSGNYDHIGRITGNHSSTPLFELEKYRVQQKNRVEQLRTAKYLDVIRGYSNITLLSGFAQFLSQHQLIVEKQESESYQVHFKKAIIATGSSPSIPPNIEGLSQTPYWTSTEALMATELPHHLIIIGGSYIALELGQSYRRLGSKVTILARSTLLSREDPLINSTMCKILQQEGVVVELHCKVDHVSYVNGQFELELTDKRHLSGDQLLIASGRKANVDNMGLDHIPIKMDEKRDIVVNEYLQTSCEDIYAVGDCTNIPKYVYVAAAAGTKAAKNIVGSLKGCQSACTTTHCDSSSSLYRLDLSIVPGVVFTDPQVATIGMTEQQAKYHGIETDSRVFHFCHLPRALVNFDERGCIKLLIERNSLLLIGAVIIAPCGGDMIQTIDIAMRCKMTVKQLAEELFPYLTFVEAIKLCAQMFFKDVSRLSCCAG